MKIFLIIVSAIVLSVAVAAVVLGPKLSGGFAIGVDSKIGTPVRLYTVNRGSLTQVVSAPGEVQPKTDVNISARFTARIEKLPFEEGEDVKAGDIVVELDARELEAALKQARARLKSDEARIEGLRASLTVAQSEWRRQKDLYETNDVSLSTLEQSESQYYSLKADLESALFGLEVTKASITQREEELNYAILRSPFNGTITKINAEVGETVVAGTMNNQGTVILNIADFSEMLVKTRVDESDIAPLRVGQNAKVYINAYPDEVFDAKVQHIGLNRLVDSSGAGYFEVDILIDTRGKRLYSGLSANVDIAVAEHENVLLVPSQCVQERQIDQLPDEVTENNKYVDLNQRYTNVVYKFIDGKAVATPVKTGPSDLRFTIIEGGLEEGDIVVSGPFKVLMSIKHNDRIVDEKSLKKDKASTVSSEENTEPSSEINAEMGTSAETDSDSSPGEDSTTNNTNNKEGEHDSPSVDNDQSDSTDSDRQAA